MPFGVEVVSRLSPGAVEVDMVRSLVTELRVEGWRCDAIWDAREMVVEAIQAVAHPHAE